MHPVVAERLRAQLLAGDPARDPVAVAERLLAIQAQDQRGARLAVRARTRGLTAADVDRALGDERSLVITWLNRGTLHLVRSDDYPWLHALTTPPLLAANARRLAQEGVDSAAAERGVAVIEGALAEAGPLTRRELAAHLERARVRTGGQAIVHILMLASLRGLVVRGPMAGKQHAWALVRDWLGPQPPVNRDRALAELARRFLAGHAPADDRDLAKWSGLPLRDARAGLAAIASRRPARAFAAEPPPRLLGAFDPLLHGWVSREPILGSARDVVTVNGHFRPFALVCGRAAALWTMSRDGALVLDPFRRLTGAERAALEEDVTDVRRFLALA